MKRFLLTLAAVLFATIAFAQKYTNPTLEGGDKSQTLDVQLQTLVNSKLDKEALGINGKMVISFFAFKVNAQGKVENFKFSNESLIAPAIDKEAAAKVNAAIQKIIEESKWTPGTKDGAPCGFDIGSARIRIR